MYGGDFPSLSTAKQWWRPPELLRCKLGIDEFEFRSHQNCGGGRFQIPIHRMPITDWIERRVDEVEDENIRTGVPVLFGDGNALGVRRPRAVSLQGTRDKLVGLSDALC